MCIRDRYMYDIQDNGTSSIKLTPKEEQAYKVEQAHMLKVREETNKRPRLQGGEPDPNYMPQTFARKVLQALFNGPDTPYRKQLIDDFYKYRTSPKIGQTFAEAQKDLKILREGYSKQSADAATQFGPLDKAEGKGLPPSWRNNN